MNSIKKSNIFFIKLGITLIVGFIFSYVYMQNSFFLENLNNKFKDMFFNVRGGVAPSEQIVIVDFDEKTLSALGGFSRKKLAQVIDNLTKAEASIIGLDMAFPRVDNSSPKNMCEMYGINFPSAQDHDLILAKAFKNSSLISGYIFDFSSHDLRGEIPNMPYIFIQKDFMKKEYLPQADGLISNIQVLQSSSYSSGFFNLIADDDGVVRSLPLIIKYQDNFYPSLVLEMARVLLKKKNIKIQYSTAGISNIRLDNFIVPTDRFGRLMINFKGTSKSYKYICAKDIYNNTFKKEDIKDKIIFIGASTSRFLDLRATPLDSTFAGVEVHATALDNILNLDFLTKPDWIEGADLAILFIVLFAVLVFSFLRPIKNIIFVISIMFGFLYMVFYTFVNFGLILGVIYPLMAGFTLYSILTLLHYWLESRQKDKLNQQLFAEMLNRQNIIEQKVKEKTEDLEIALREKNILFKELHHRVKNNLQLILSIVRLQQYDQKNYLINEEFEKLQGRIKSIAKTHEMLCESEDISNVDMSDYIGQLSEEIESSIMQNDIKIELDIAATLPLRQAVYVGLIVNELISNSIKHAFKDDGGKIFVSLHKNQESYVLKITDSGSISEREMTMGTSLGLKLVDSLVVSQLEGTIEMKTQERFEYTIKFCLSEGE